jgi:hypothetical protein
MNHAALTESFDAIYVINLRTRTDRRAEMVEQFERVGVDPSSTKIEFFDAARPDDAAGFPSRGARGCFLSHLGILKAALKSGHDTILILEDDVNFVDGLAVAFANAAPRLREPDWALAYLGALAVNPPMESAELVGVVPPASSIMGSHMLAIRRDAMASVADYFEAMQARPAGDPAGGPMHVDGAYSWFRRTHAEFMTLLCTPPLGYQRPSRTDIHDLKWFDRLPLVRNAVGQLRKLRARLRIT